jgi:SAM-dependent methyltransferase
MLAFLNAAEIGRHGLSQRSIIGRCDGLGLGIDPARLAARGYAWCVEQNLEGPAVAYPQSYDAIIFSHVLEHLHDPEQCVARTLPFLKDGGLCLGGSPGIPPLLVRSREPQLRRTAQRYGHVSAFSPGRVYALAARTGLTVEWLSSAYLMHKTGSILENYAWWVRLNLVFGALVPSWPGELYWARRKPFRVVSASSGGVG